VITSCPDLPGWMVKLPGLIEALTVGVITASVTGADVLAAYDALPRYAAVRLYTPFLLNDVCRVAVLFAARVAVPILVIPTGKKPKCRWIPSPKPKTTIS
jgi:hypothetical protein